MIWQVNYNIIVLNSGVYDTNYYLFAYKANVVSNYLPVNMRLIMQHKYIN